MMTRREKLHPLLLAYRTLANLWFIGAVNLGVTLMIIRRVSEEKVDLTMSWATMAMDQVIIAAGWVLVTIGVKHRREDKAQWSRIERNQGELLELLRAHHQTSIAQQTKLEEIETILDLRIPKVAS